MKPQKVLHLHLEEAKKKPNINHLYGMFRKLDGWFTYIDFTQQNGFSNVHSRQMREIPSMLAYRGLFEQLELNKDCRIIAEAVIPDTDFYEMNGLFNRSKGNCHVDNVVFHIHDIVEFENLAKPFNERYDDLVMLEMRGLPKGLERVPLLGVSGDRDYWFEKAGEIWNEGGEGLILKQWDAPYQPDKRNSSLMKIKLEDTYDLLCISYYTSEGKKGNLAHNLLLKDKNGVKVSVVIAEHSLIDEFDYISPVGAVVEIKCMLRTKDGIYREPRYSAIRYDKNSSEID